jgi:hypothetical protein
VSTTTSVGDKRKYRDGRGQFSVLRISDRRLDVVSHHETLDQAFEAAQGYASKARFSGLEARILQRD